MDTHFGTIKTQQKVRGVHKGSTFSYNLYAYFSIKALFHVKGLQRLSSDAWARLSVSFNITKVDFLYARALSAYSLPIFAKFLLPVRVLVHHVPTSKEVKGVGSTEKIACGELCLCHINKVLRLIYQQYTWSLPTHH